MSIEKCADAGSYSGQGRPACEGVAPLPACMACMMKYLRRLEFELRDRMPEGVSLGYRQSGYFDRPMILDVKQVATFTAPLVDQIAEIMVDHNDYVMQLRQVREEEPVENVWEGHENGGAAAT